MKEICAWLPSCTGDGVEELVARIASCHVGFEWVKGSHLQVECKRFFVKVSGKWFGFGSVSILDIVRRS